MKMKDDTSTVPDWLSKRLGSAPRVERHTITLVLRSIGGQSLSEGERLKALIKRLRRSYGFRCLDIQREKEGSKNES
jgi:hypothetical protein